MTRGRLITIEGIDGTGKTTLAMRLRDALAGRGLAVTLLREPGGVELSERLREIVKDPSLNVGDRAEALIYAAARAQLVAEAVVPRLERGTWVLLDRFVDSSLAYQGAGRKLGMKAIAELNWFATGGLSPDRTLLLTLAPEAARARADDRPGAPDRLELEDQSFFGRVLEGYGEIARLDPHRVRGISAVGSPEQVLEAALRELEDLV